MALATALAFSAGEGTAFAKSCADTADYSALSVRVLQSDLLIAGLRCRAHSQYNSFVRKFAPTLQVHGENLQKFFRTQYGKGSTRKLDVMVTQLANNASNRAGKDTHGYCATIGALFDEVMAVDAKQLATYAMSRPYAGTHGFKPCSTVKLAKDAMQIPGAE
ncbi:MAG: hypothetical protein AB7P52_06115 [Alphaproteobacteria bacterium]